MPGTDVQAVLEAAAVLDIAEVQLFREAYRKWHGTSIDEQQLDRRFVAYMFAGAVPPWVRDYARRVLDEAAHHRLDPVRFGVHPRLGRRVRFGIGMLVLQFAIFALLVWVTDWSLGLLPFARSCLLPPCY